MNDKTSTKQPVRAADDKPMQPARGSAEPLIATVIEIAWNDGLRHRFERRGDTWTLTLEGSPLDGGPRITGYQRGDLERVLGRAFDGTRDGCSGDA